MTDPDMPVGVRAPSAAPPGQDRPSGLPRFFERPWSEYVLGFALVYLITAWIIVVAVDAFNAGGTRDALANLDLALPYVWYHLFDDGNVTEQIVYLMLGGTALVGALTAGTLFATGRREAAIFWLIMSVAGILLLIEDAGDTRKRFAAYLAAFAPGDRGPRVAGELLFFAGLAAVPLYAVLRYWRWPWRSGPTRRYLIAGFVTYGSIALMNGTRDIGGDYGWYARAGAFLEHSVFGGRLLKAPPGFWHDRPDPTGYMLMDTLVEESVEFLAAAMLLAAALAYARHLRRDSTIAEHPYGR